MGGKRSIVFFLPIVTLYFWLGVGVAKASAACDVPVVNAVLQSSGVVTVDHAVVQCDVAPSSLTVSLASNFINTPGEPIVGLTLVYQSGPAPILLGPANFPILPSQAVATTSGPLLEMPLIFTDPGEYVLQALRNFPGEGISISVKVGQSCNVKPISQKFLQAVDAQGEIVPWACEIYNHPYMWDNPSQYCTLTPALTRIAQKGCSLTVLTMALSAASIRFSDPSFLNSYMVNHPGDFDLASHNVSWETTVDDLAFTSGKPLQFVRFESTSTEDLEAKLCGNGFPVVVGVNLRPSTLGAGLVPGHFVLVTGKTDDHFDIVDPGHPDRTTLDDYQGLFQTRGYIQDPTGDRSALHLSIADAELLVMDPGARRTGFDSRSMQDLREIPQSSYTRDALENDETGAAPTQVGHFLDVRQPASGTYAITVRGIRLQRYSLSIRIFSADGSPQPILSADGIAGPGSASNFQIQVAVSQGSSSRIARTASLQGTLADISNSLQLGLINNRGIANSLSQKIQAAQRAVGSAKASIVAAFKNQVNAQAGKHVTGIAVQVLLEDADSLLSQNQ